MEKVNFLVDGNYALNVDGHHIDLHNNFDLKNIEYSINQNRVSMLWTKTTGDWVRDDHVAQVRIVFENILYLKIQTGTSGKYEGMETLLFIGYLHSDDEELMDGCLDESESTPAYHMICGFESGFAIKIFSDKVTCFLI